MKAAAVRVVAHRVDSLTLAYRVELAPGLIAHLEERAKVARRRGRAAVDCLGLVGELGYSRADRCWTITSARHNVRIDLKSPGGSGTPDSETYEPGWLLEVIWRAQALAALGDVGLAVAEGRALAEKLGTPRTVKEIGRTKDGEPVYRGHGGVYEACARRVDICADVAGKVVDAADIERLVRRSRAKWQIHDNSDPKVTTLPSSFAAGKTKSEIKAALLEAAASADVHGAKRTTGISVGKGGAIMARIYDKRIHLEQRPERHDEGFRWLAGGWRAHRRTREGTNGSEVVWLDEDAAEMAERWTQGDEFESPEPIARVEYQIRGTAMREFGIRDPEISVDPSTKEPLADRFVNAQGTTIDAELVREMKPGERAAWRPIPVPLADRIDALWQKCLDWMRLVERGASRNSRGKDDPLWTELRAVTFKRRAAPATRFRVRGGATADQVLGCVLSILSVHQALAFEHVAYGENEDGDESDEREVTARVEDLFLRAAPKIAAALVARHGPVKAREHLGEINNSARARFLEATCA